MRFLIAALVLSASPALANTCGPTVTIVPGDTLSGIAARCDVTLESLYATNPGVDARDLRNGATLNLEVGAAGMSEAEALYRSVFHGGYSPSATCFGQELQVDLTEDRVYLGETACDIAGLSVNGAAIGITATNCNAEGEPSPDRQIKATRSGDILSISFDGTVTELQRCTDR